MMRAALERLAQSLSRPAHPYSAVTATFMQIDVQRLKSDLRLGKRGAEHGCAEQPASDSEGFDDVEQEIAQRIEAERKSCIDLYLDNMRTYAERRRSLDIEGRVSEIDAAAREAIADFRVQVSDGLDHLHNLRADITEVENEYRDFKETHRLKRAAHYPEARVLQIAILVVILGIEIALNATFLSAGHELGYLGAIGIAAGVTALNILGSFLLGWKWFPNLFHRNFLRKAAGLLIVLAYLPAVLAFNLFVGHFREAFGARLSAETVVRVTESFSANPLGLAEFESWLLVGLGCLFAVIAAGDGLSFDDRYPDYGRVARKRKLVKGQYAGEKSKLIEELEETKTQATEAMRMAREDITKRRAEYYAVQDAQDRMRKGFRVHLDYLESVANDLLAAYQQANKLARKTPAPAHFDKAFTLVRPDLSEPADDAEVTRAKVEEEVKRAATVLDSRLEEVFAEYEAAVARYRQLGELIGEESGRGARPQAA